MLGAVAASAAFLRTRAEEITLDKEEETPPAESENFTWPRAHTYCIPCETRVGTCFVGSCYDWRGPTKCFLTRCLCMDGYCAAEDALPGSERCVPQICIEGPHPAPYRPNVYTMLFALLGGNRDFPVDLEGRSLRNFLLKTGMSSGWLLLIGLVVTIVTLVLFCVYRPPKRKRKRHDVQQGVARGGSMSSLFEWRAQRTPSTGSLTSSASTSSPAVYTKPHLQPIVIVGSLVLVLSVCGIVTRGMFWHITQQCMFEILALLKQNAVTLQEQGVVVFRTSMQLNQTLESLATKCNKDPLMDTLAVKAGQSIKGYVDAIRHLHASLDRMPAIVDNFRHILQAKGPLFLWIPLAPLLVVTAVCVIMVTEAVVIFCCGNSKWAIRVDRSLRYAAVLYAAMIMFIAAFGALGMTTGVIAGTFCMDPDANMLKLALAFQQGNRTALYNLSQYYISGIGDNPVNTYAKQGRTLILQVKDVYIQFEGLIKAYYVLCPPLENVGIRAIADEALSVLRHVVELMDPANIYKYYRQGVREAFCTDTVSSLGSFPIFTMFVGMVCFPYCAVLTHRFMVHWAYWSLQFEEQEERAGTSTDEERSLQSSPDGASEGSEDNSDSESYGGHDGWTDAALVKSSRVRAGA